MVYSEQVSVPLRGFLFLTTTGGNLLCSPILRVSVPLRGFLFLTIRYIFRKSFILPRFRPLTGIFVFNVHLMPS